MPQSTDPLVAAGNSAANNVNNTGSSFSFGDGGTVSTQGVYTAPGGGTGIPAVTPVAPVTSPVVPVSQIAPATPLNIQSTIPTTPNPSGLGSISASTANTTKSIQDYLTQLTPQPTAASQESTGIMQRIKDLLPQTAGKQQATIEEQNRQNVPQLQKTLTDINSQISIKDAEFRQSTINAEGKPISMGEIGAQQKQIAHERESELGLLQARAYAVSGQLQVATNLADRAVALKYAPIEEELAIREKQLALIQPTLDKEEARQAEAAKLVIQDQRDAIAAEKEKQTQINSVMINAAQYGADNATLQSIQEAQSLGEAIQYAGPFLSAEFKNVLKQQTFENNLASDKFKLDKFIGNENLSLNKQGFKLEMAKLGAIQNADGSFTIPASSAEGFTLGENQTRYDAKGVAIAGAGVNASKPASPQALAATQANIEQIQNLFGKVDSANAVGTNALSRLNLANAFNGEKDNFIANVEQITGQLTLDNLIKAKSNGATFGALSEGELALLQGSATKINSWAVKKDGKVVGYKTTPAEFNKELDKINNFAKLDYVLKGGSPTNIGASQEQDGSIWTTNRDGSRTMLLESSSLGKVGNTSKASFKTFEDYASRVGSGKKVSGSPFHKNGEVDIDGKIGDPIPAFEGGKVIAVKDNGSKSYGKHVIVQMPNGDEIIYGHLSDFNVKEGQIIPSGYVVGKMGNSGNVIAQNGGDGSHLHIEKRNKKGKVIALNLDHSIA